MQRVRGLDTLHQLAREAWSVGRDRHPDAFRKVPHVMQLVPDVGGGEDVLYVAGVAAYSATSQNVRPS